MKAFGGSGTKLLPMLQSGSQGIDDLAQKAKAMGLVMSDDDANTAAALTDAMDLLKRQFAAFVNIIGAAVSGPLTQFLSAMSYITSKVIALNYRKTGASPYEITG